MDIVVKGRRTDVPDHYRTLVSDKLAKLEKLDHKVIRVVVELSKEANPRRADQSDRIELTLHSKGPVIRAEAAAPDKYVALDLAVDKLMARIRKAADRRRVHHGNRTPISVAAATAALNGNSAEAVAPAESDADQYAPPPDSGPMVVREKTHQATPMSLDQALYEMELVGHDFYLFVDVQSTMPSVVYRRRGYDYGVIRLDV